MANKLGLLICRVKLSILVDNRKCEDEDCLLGGLRTHSAGIYWRSPLCDYVTVFILFFIPTIKSLIVLYPPISNLAGFNLDPKKETRIPNTKEINSHVLKVSITE
jgi:hypothetical protein